MPAAADLAGIPANSRRTAVAAGNSGCAPEPSVAAERRRSAPDGLRAFVQRIRSAPFRSSARRLRPDAWTRTVIHRLFAGQVPAGGGPAPLDVPAIRKDFPVLNQQVHGKPLVWLDNAATTQKPQSVIDALSRLLRRRTTRTSTAGRTPWRPGRPTPSSRHGRRCRLSWAPSSAKEIIFVRGTTEGINLVAQTYGRKFLQPGDEIVLSTLEHHANIVPWQMVAKEKGAVLRVIPVTDRGEIMLEEYQALLGPRTGWWRLTQASNSLGTILPVAEMTQMAKRYNARVLIDGAQSVSHLPVNVQQLGCDFFVFSGHKIFAPTGIGVVYAKEELLEIMPPWQGGGNMIRNVTFEETTYSEAPAKFEAGTPNVADAVGLGAALDYVNRLGLANIAKYEQELLQYATEQLSRINGVRLDRNRRGKGGRAFLRAARPADRRSRPTAGSRRDRRAGRPSLRPAVAAALRLGGHRSAVAGLLQYQGRDRSTGRRSESHLAVVEILCSRKRSRRGPRTRAANCSPTSFNQGAQSLRLPGRWRIRGNRGRSRFGRSR